MELEELNSFTSFWYKLCKVVFTIFRLRLISVELLNIWIKIKYTWRDHWTWSIHHTQNRGVRSNYQKIENNRFLFTLNYISCFYFMHYYILFHLFLFIHLNFGYTRAKYITVAVLDTIVKIFLYKFKMSKYVNIINNESRIRRMRMRWKAKANLGNMSIKV